MNDQKKVDVGIRLDAIRGERIRLFDGNLRSEDAPLCRPELALWAEIEDEIGPAIVVSMSAVWGAPTRWASLTTDEARTLAVKLVAMADKVDAISKDAA